MADHGRSAAGHADLYRYLLRRNPAAIKGAGLERAAEMRHVSIPQLHALAETVPRRYRVLVLVAATAGCARASWSGFAAIASTWPGPYPCGRAGG